MSNLEEPWVFTTLEAVKYIRTRQGSVYRTFKVSFPDYPENVTPSNDYLAWVWDWLIMHTPFEEDPTDPDLLVWNVADDSDFLETEEKFTHRGRTDWN